MELRQYWRIIRRRLWIVLLLPLLVLVASLALRRPAPPVFQASLRMTVDVPPLPVTEGMDFDPRLTAAQASEYLVDDFSLLVTSQAFAADVSARLAEQGIAIAPGSIRASAASQKVHRITTLWITRGNPDEAAVIAQAAAEALKEDSARYFARLGTSSAQLHLIDPPTVVALGPGLRQKVDIPLRVLLALIAALGLVFLLDYLDDSVRDVAEVEALGLMVLGEVPRNPRRWDVVLWRR